MDAVIAPEPSENEREVLLAALEGSETAPYESDWRRAALREGTESEEP